MSASSDAAQGTGRRAGGDAHWQAGTRTEALNHVKAKRAFALWDPRLLLGYMAVLQTIEC